MDAKEILKRLSPLPLSRQFRVLTEALSILRARAQQEQEMVDLGNGADLDRIGKRLFQCAYPEAEIDESLAGDGTGDGSDAVLDGVRYEIKTVHNSERETWRLCWAQDVEKDANYRYFVILWKAGTPKTPVPRQDILGYIHAVLVWENAKLSHEYRKKHSSKLSLTLSKCKLGGDAVYKMQKAPRKKRGKVAILMRLPCLVKRTGDFEDFFHV